MSFTLNIGPLTRVVYVVFGLVLMGLAVWGPMPGLAWSVVVGLLGLAAIVEGAVGF